MSDPEVLQPEVVDRPGTAVVPAAPDAGRDSALVAAAEAALSEPGAPGHDEFWALAAAARILCMSGAAPKAIRRDPHLALHVALVGRDLGISPSAALELIDIIKVRDGEYRLSLSPQLMNGQLRRLGIGCILPAERTAERAEAVAFGPKGPDRRCTRTGVVAHVGKCQCDVLGTSEFTWEDAQMAGLAGAECEPGQHKTVTRNRQSGGSYQTCGCNQGYITYPKRMLWWRASGFAGDDFFPEAGLGMYQPEALGSHVDEHGRPIDVDSVELPPGYEPAAVGQGSASGRQQQPERRASPDELYELQLRILSLPEGHKGALRQKWNDEDSRVRGHKPHALPQRLLATAKAMVNAHWAQARAAGLSEEQLRALALNELGHTITALFGAYPAPSAPQSGHEPAPGTDTPPEAPQADSGAHGGADETSDPEPDWGSMLAALADEVRRLCEGVPEAVITRIAEDVKGLHWQHLNAELERAELAGAASFPPESPIDYRRMGLVAYRLETLRSTGVLDGGADAS